MNNIETKSSEEMRPHVGMTVWYYTGKEKIWGETSRSWKIGIYKSTAETVPKKGFPQYPYFLTEQAAKEDSQRREWVFENKHPIREQVRHCDFHQLKQIAAIIGYEEQP